MPQLHLIQTSMTLKVFKSNYSRFVSEQDALLFLNDGLTNLHSNDYFSEPFKQITLSNRLFAIKEQIIAHGIDFNCVDSQVDSIDYDKFVNLCQNASKIASW